MSRFNKIIDADECWNNRPECLNESMDDIEKSAYNRGWNKCLHYMYEAIENTNSIAFPVCDKIHSPFQNDIFSYIYTSFKQLYPDREFTAYWVPELKDSDDNEVYGVTTFADDGTIEICVSGKLTVTDAAEVFAHELAHLAVGDSDEQHGEEWESAFEAIYQKYNELTDGDTDE